MRRFLPLLLAVLLAFSLAGCAEPSPLPSPSETPGPPPPPPPAAARFSLGYDPAASLHPLAGSSQVNQELTGLVYQGLYELDNCFAPQPVLASSAAPGEDGLSWRVTLKGGAVFSDGTPLTAHHAAASLNAARAGGPYAARLAGITAVAAQDDATLSIALAAPNGSLPALLDVPIVLEREEGLPLGTGYYQYESAGERLYLQANPRHSGAAALPYAAIPLTAVSGADERIAAFDSGAVTAVTTRFSSPYALGYSSSYETCDYPTTTLLFVGFRCSGGPCQSEAVRRAFARAIDRAGTAQALLSGHADPACLPISPLHREYAGKAAALLDFDLEQAAALLAEAGYERNEEDGLLYRHRAALEVTLLVNSDNESRQGAAEALAASLAELGVAVRVDTLPWEGYTAALAAGKFDLYLGEVTLTGDFDPAPLLTGALNYGRHDSWELAQAVDAWRGAQGNDRIRAAEELWIRFAQEAPIAPVCFQRGSLLVRWGMASNLQPTRGNPFYRMEEWTTTAAYK